MNTYKKKTNLTGKPQRRKKVLHYFEKIEIFALIVYPFTMTKCDSFYKVALQTTRLLQRMVRENRCKTFCE